MLTVPEIAKKIGSLYGALKENADSVDDVAKKINDILIYGERISPQFLSPAWEVFAKERGVKN